MLMEMEKNITDDVQNRQLILFGHANGMEKTRWPRYYQNGNHRKCVNEAGRDGAGETI
jgi:hypothetical protein